MKCWDLSHERCLPMVAPWLLFANVILLGLWLDGRMPTWSLTEVMFPLLTALALLAVTIAMFLVIRCCPESTRTCYQPRWLCQCIGEQCFACCTYRMDATPSCSHSQNHIVGHMRYQNESIVCGFGCLRCIRSRRRFGGFDGGGFGSDDLNQDRVRLGEPEYECGCIGDKHWLIAAWSRRRSHSPLHFLFDYTRRGSDLSVIAMLVLLVLSVLLIIAKASGDAPELRWYGGASIIVPVVLFLVLLCCAPLLVLKGLDLDFIGVWWLCLIPVNIVGGLLMYKVAISLHFVSNFQHSTPHAHGFTPLLSFDCAQFQNQSISLVNIFLPFFITNGLVLFVIWMTAFCTCCSAYCDRPRCLHCMRSDARRAMVMCPIATIILGLVVAFEVFLVLHDAGVLLVPDSQGGGGGGNWGWRFTMIPLAILLGLISMGCCIIFLCVDRSYPLAPSAPVDNESAVRDMNMPLQRPSQRTYRDDDFFDDNDL